MVDRIYKASQAGLVRPQAVSCLSEHLQHIQGIALLLQVPEWCEPEWRSAMESCWEVNPDRRPSLRELARRLEHIIQNA